MSLTYFSVDVETTGINPFVKSHQLATIGAVAVSEKGLIIGSFYSRLEYDPDGWEESTKEWWKKQNKAAKQEMFSTKRDDPVEMAKLFENWVMEMSENASGSMDSVFAASPVTFDWGHVQRWLAESGAPMPFGYRTLCLRSLAMGMNGGGLSCGLSMTMRHSPLIPHHALHDAQAHAIDLIGYMKGPIWEILEDLGKRQKINHDPPV